MKIDLLVKNYAAATESFLQAAGELQPGDLDRAPAGEWTPRMVVHHLAHADAYCLTRIIQVLSEPGTTIRSFSEEALAGSRLLDYQHAPIEPALALFSATRAEAARLLSTLSDEDLSRSCMHSEYGELTLEAMIVHFTGHPLGHVQQILEAAGR